MTALYVALLGALGSLVRYALSGAVQRAAGARFPAGTLTVNVIGSAAIGLVMTLYAARQGLDSRARIALTAGFLGGFTTYSSFAYETFALWERRAFGLVVANVGLTLVVCFLACAGGVFLARSLSP